MNAFELAPDTMGGGGTDGTTTACLPVARGLSDERLRLELLTMFDECMRPKLKPVTVKCRHFLHTSCGKVLYSTPGENNQATCKCHSPTKKQSSSIIRQYSHVTDEDLCGRPECWSFHLREHEESNTDDNSVVFAGCQGVAGPESAIWSKDGTVRGVTNRVRAGIATFLHTCGQRKVGQESGRVVVYISSLGIIRETFQKCLSVQSILATLLVHYDERDVYLNKNHQGQLMDRLGMEMLTVPQVFVEGQHLGDAQDIERLNESGQLRQIMKPYKKVNATMPCMKCGGYKLLPCMACLGTKKSVRHRNAFTEEFAALRCMQCDERGLVKCEACHLTAN